MLDLAPKTTTKSCKNVVSGQVFRKTANMRSARAGAVQHCFCHIILSRFRPQCGPGGPLKSVCKILMQNTFILCVFMSFWVPRVLPKPSPGDNFAIIFATFCMTWADDLSRLVQTSSFNWQATLQTYKSTVLKPKLSFWHSNRQTYKSIG